MTHPEDLKSLFEIWNTTVGADKPLPRLDHRAFHTFIAELPEAARQVDVRVPAPIRNNRPFLKHFIVPIKKVMAYVVRPFMNMYLEKQVRVNHVTLIMGYKIAALEQRLMQLEAAAKRKPHG